MAKVSTQTETVVNLKSVTLVLSEDEAVAVLSALGRIGGVGPGRVVTDLIYHDLHRTLTDAKVDVSTYLSRHKWHLNTEKPGHAYFSTQDRHV